MQSNTDPLWKQGYCFTVHCDSFPTLFQFKIRNLKAKDTERLLVSRSLKHYIICPPVLLSPIAETSPYLSFPSLASSFKLEVRQGLHSDGTVWSGVVLTSVSCSAHSMKRVTYSYGRWDILQWQLFWQLLVNLQSSPLRAPSSVPLIHHSIWINTLTVQLLLQIRGVFCLFGFFLLNSSGQKTEFKR